MQTQTAEPTRRWPLGLALGLLAAGVGIAVHLVRVKLQLEYPGPDFQSACSVDGAFQCDAVQRSPYATLFGVPIALLSVPAYAVMGYLAIVGLRRRQGSGVAVAWLAALALLAVGYSAWLAWVSSSVLRAYCLFCILLYVVNLGTLVAALGARGGAPHRTLAEAVRGLLDGRGPLMRALLVLVVVGAVSWMGWSRAEAARAAAYKARIAEDVEQVGRDAEEARSEGGGSSGSEGSGEPGREVTDNGVTRYDIPVEAGDYVKGPDDAAVTVVLFEDFECGYCRRLAGILKPLQREHEGRVRWVFKHYPLNGDCNPRLGNRTPHEGACRAARAAHCAHEQDGFWRMYERLFQNQGRFSKEQLFGYAEALELDMEAFEACWGSDRPDEKIRADVKLASDMKIIGTPRIYIDNRLVQGSLAREVLDEHIREAMNDP